jgi:hypothetical protein
MVGVDRSPNVGIDGRLSSGFSGSWSDHRDRWGPGVWVGFRFEFGLPVDELLKCDCIDGCL